MTSSIKLLAMIALGLLLSVKSWENEREIANMAISEVVEFHRPLNPKAISAIAARFQKISSRRDKVKVAATLYCYGERRGLEFLRSALTKDGDMDAAAALASFHDAPSLDKILALLVQKFSARAELKEGGPEQREKADVPWALMEAIGHWPDPRIEPVASKLCHLRPNDSLALLLAASRDRQDCRGIINAARGGKELEDDDEAASLGLAADIAWARINPDVALERALKVKLSGPALLSNPLVVEFLFDCKLAKPKSAAPVLRDFISWAFKNDSLQKDPRRNTVGVLAIDCLVAIDRGSAKFVQNVLKHDNVLFTLNEKDAVRLREALDLVSGINELFSSAKGQHWERVQEESLKLPVVPYYMNFIDQKSYAEMFPYMANSLDATLPSHR